MSNPSTAIGEHGQLSHQRTVKLADAQKMLGRVPEKADILNGTPAPGTIMDLSVYSIQPGIAGQIIALLCGAAVVIILAALASGFQPLLFLKSMDNRYSNSQTQLALWFGAAMTSYLALLFLRLYFGGTNYLGGIAIAANVLALSGLSALTFGGAKMVTAQKTGGNPPVDPPAAGAALPPDRKTRAPVSNLLKDLVQNDENQPDLGDFQMIFITLTAVVIYLASVFYSLGSIPLQAHVSLPDVDTSLLAAFGLGQGAYLMKKGALPPGKG